MCVTNARALPVQLGDRFLTLDELIQERSVEPIQTIADIQAMAVDLFESDDELDEFIEYLQARRGRRLS